MVRRTKEDAVATRNSLLDAAEQVFYDKGVSRASLGDIAQAAGATRGAIYWHFKDKADLFNAMMDRVTLPLECAYGFGGVGVEDGAPLWRLRGAVRAVLRAVTTDERARRVFEIAMYKVEYVQELDAVRDRHVMACEGFRARLREDVVSAAKAQGLALPMSADVAAMGLWALFDGLLQGWMLNRGGFDLLEVGRVTVDAYLKGLGFELGAD
ncbi:MAG: TetR family transcriptional regulator [Comamonadaceae bacterium]|nr:TetR family transcriptional regulator [Comamonadaceae bacterium]